MNIRKVLCNLAREHHWRTLYDLCDCKRYEHHTATTLVERPGPAARLGVLKIPRPWPPKAKKLLIVFVPEILWLKNRRYFFRALREKGVVAIRGFGLQSWSTIRIAPFLQAIHDGEYVVFRSPDNGQAYPVFDMTKPDPLYWSAVDALLVELKEADLELVWSLGDECSARIGGPNKHLYPFLNSMQAMSKEEDWPFIVPQAATQHFIYSPDGLYGTQRRTWWLKWAQITIPRLQASGVPFYIEDMNEMTYLGWNDPHVNKPWWPIEWRRWYCGEIEKLGVPKERIIISGLTDLPLRQRYNYCQHVIVRPEDITTEALERGWIVSGDGGTKGRSLTDVDIKGRHGVSVEDARKMAEKGLRIELMLKLLWKDNDEFANLTYLTAEHLAVVEAIREVYNR